MRKLTPAEKSLANFIKTCPNLCTTKGDTLSHLMGGNVEGIDSRFMTSDMSEEIYDNLMHKVFVNTLVKVASDLT